MPLSVGVKLGPYQILAPIGAGGRGEAYRARDTRLSRVSLFILGTLVRLGGAGEPVRVA
jgi:hypothetical protein